MATDIVLVTTATAGASIAVDRIGSTDYQLVKVVDGLASGTGAVAATTGVPGIAATGLVVAVIPGVSVSAQVSGSVTVLGTALVSVVPGVSVTIQQGASVTIQQGASITGSVNIVSVALVSVSGVVAITTAASVSVTGLPVWLNPTQAVVVNTIAAGFSVNALVTGPVSISAGVLQSITVMSTLVTLLGTVAVNVVAGAAGGGSVTTTAPGITATGQVMWVVGGQSTTVSPVFVSIIQTSVSVAAVPTVNTVVTILGTQIVSIVPGVSITGSVNLVSQALVSIAGIVAVTTAVSVSVSGLPVWINPTAALGTIVTVLGTQIVSVVPGLSVSAVISGTVTDIPVDRTTGTPAAAASGQMVWVVNPGAAVATTVLTVQTILGTAVVSVVPGVSVTIQQGASITGTVSGLQVANSPVCIIMSSTLIGSNTTMLMTVYTSNTFVATGTSAYAIPSGKTFRIMAMQIIAVSSAVLNQAKLAILLGTATASISVTSTVGIAAVLPFAIQASTTPFALGAFVADIPGTTTMCPAMIGGTSCSILGGVIQGYLF